MNDFSNDIGHLILRLRQEYLSSLKHELDRSGIEEITPTMTRLLVPLSYEKTVTVNELAELAGLNKSTTALQVNLMYNEGLVTKTGDKNDRRVVWVSLSTKGETVIVEILEALSRISRKALNGVASDEQAAIKRGLFKILTNLSE